MSIIATPHVQQPRPKIVRKIPRRIQLATYMANVDAPWESVSRTIACPRQDMIVYVKFLAQQISLFSALLLQTQTVTYMVNAVVLLTVRVLLFPIALAAVPWEMTSVAVPAAQHRLAPIAHIPAKRVH